MQFTKLSKSLAGGAVTALAFGVFGTSAAYAGEVTGTGESLQIAPHTLHGKSLCAFSGLNDTFSGDPAVPDADGFTRTQNWGQIPAAVRKEIAAFTGPGVACNPTKSAGEP